MMMAFSPPHSVNAASMTPLKHKISPLSTMAVTKIFNYSETLKDGSTIARHDSSSSTTTTTQPCNDDLEAMVGTLLEIVNGVPCRKKSRTDAPQYHALPRCFLAVPSNDTIDSNAESLPSLTPSSDVENKKRSTISKSIRRAFGSEFLKDTTKKPAKNRLPFRDITNGGDASKTADEAEFLSQAVGESVLADSPFRATSKRLFHDQEETTHPLLSVGTESDDMSSHQLSETPLLNFTPRWKKTSVAISPFMNRHPLAFQLDDASNDDDTMDMKDSFVDGAAFPNRIPIATNPSTPSTATTIWSVDGGETPASSFYYPKDKARTPFVFSLGFVVQDMGQRRWNKMKQNSKQGISDSCSMPNMEHSEDDASSSMTY
jgi:hypothetical protein